MKKKEYKRRCRIGGKLLFRQNLLRRILKVLSTLAKDKKGSGLLNQKKNTVSTNALTVARTAVKTGSGSEKN